MDFPSRDPSIEKNMDDIFAIQDEIAINIVENLDITLRLKDKESVMIDPSASVKAYNELLQIGNIHSSSIQDEIERLNNIIENGGWHFCNLKTPENLLYKYKNLCETNDPYAFKEKIDAKFLQLETVKENIKNKKDIIGREDEFNVVSLDQNFPKYLLDNLSKYREWFE